MSSLMDTWNAVASIFTASDLITLAIMAVIVLAAGFIMQGFDAIISTTIVALVLFGLAGYVRAVAMNGQNAAQLAESQWHGFLGLTMQTVLAYAIAFAIGIAVIHLIRSIVAR